MAKDATYIKLISKQEWKNLANLKRSRDPLCELCLKDGRYEPAQCVHHIIPVESAKTREQMEQLMYDYDNLQSLCREHHRQIHMQMRSFGRDAVRRHNDARTQRFAKKYFGKGDEAGQP